MDRDLSKAIIFDREASLRNWSVGYGQGDDVRKGKEGDQDQPYLSL